MPVVDTKRDTRPRARRSPGGRSGRRRRSSATGPRLEVSAAAYQSLRDLIAAGRLAPGAPLIEADLSKRLGVSRTPIREALQRLQQEGFATASPVGQTLRPIVSPLTAADVAEVFLMMGAFEATAARAAAALEPAARSALVADLERMTARLRAACTARPPDLGTAQVVGARFHRLIFEAGAGPRLLGELDVLQPQSNRYGRAYNHVVPDEVESTVGELDAISAALRAGDSDAAELRVAAHWRRSLDRVRRVMAMVGEQGTW